MKRCIRCGVSLALTEFHRSPKYSDGRGNICKICKGEYDKEYRSQPKVASRRTGQALAYQKTAAEKAKRRVRQQNRKRAAGVMPKDSLFILTEAWGNECLIPGCESLDVTIDHIIPISLGGTHELLIYSRSAEGITLVRGIGL